MQYKKFSHITIPTKRWEKVDIYLFNRFLEMFGSDEEITNYINTWEFKEKKEYIKRVYPNSHWIISIKDYQEFLDELINTLPKKFRKKQAKKVLPIIDLYMGPKTFELAELENNSKIPNEKTTDEIHSDVT